MRATGILYDSLQCRRLWRELLNDHRHRYQWTATSTLLAAVKSQEAGLMDMLLGGLEQIPYQWEFVDNGTVAGVNATSSSISFNVQGTTTLDPFNVSSSSGTSIVRVIQWGNVGIGTTSPVAKLSLQGTAGANDMFDVASSTGTSVLRITNQGNVGIGTTNPGQLLDVNGVAAFGGSSAAPVK